MIDDRITPVRLVDVDGFTAAAAALARSSIHRLRRHRESVELLQPHLVQRSEPVVPDGDPNANPNGALYGNWTENTKTHGNGQL